MPVIQLGYSPRLHFSDFHARNKRWTILVAHRRAGKTVAAVNDLIEKASYNTRPNPRYGYVAPLYNQAKQIAWQYLKDYAAPFKPKISESGLFAELPHNGARITLYGADNPDAFRGLYFDGLVLDEYGNMRPSVWSEVLLPTLVDRRGWAVFMGTPNGPNHFRDMYELRKDDDRWYVCVLPYQATNVIGAEDIESIRELMTDEEFAQEMECSFAASTRGAFYAKEIELAESEGRVRDDLDFDDSPLHFSLDLGIRDDTAGWAWQERRDGFAMQVSFADNNLAIPKYVEIINAVCTMHGVQRGRIWLPHDARARSLQTGRSIVEQMVDLDAIPSIVPRQNLLDGIAAARLLFRDIHFHSGRCVDGIRALKSYHREYDEDKKAFSNIPVHDWSSHYADAFRGFALVSEPKKLRLPPPLEEVLRKERDRKQKGTHYAFTLDQLWDTQSRARTYGYDD
jgi:phage terminase large subunit